MKSIIASLSDKELGEVVFALEYAKDHHEVSEKEAQRLDRIQIKLVKALEERLNKRATP